MKSGVQMDMRGREYDPFDAQKIAKAATLWRLGWDTRDIAWLWIVPEHHVYECLERIKEVSRAYQRQNAGC